MVGDNRWDELFTESRGVLLEYFRNGSDDTASVSRARIAQSVLSAVTRHESTESALQTTKVVIARGIARDAEEFKEYIRLSMPDMARHMLPEGDGKDTKEQI